MLNMSISTLEFCDNQEDTLFIPLFLLVFCPFPRQTRNYFLLHSALFCCCSVYSCQHLLDSKSLWGIDLYNVVSRVSYCTKVVSNKIKDSISTTSFLFFSRREWVVSRASFQKLTVKNGGACREAHSALSIQLRCCGATWRRSQIPYLRPRLLCLLIYAAHHLNWSRPYVPSLDIHPLSTSSQRMSTINSNTKIFKATMNGSGSSHAWFALFLVCMHACMLHMIPAFESRGW